MTVHHRRTGTAMFMSLDLLTAKGVNGLVPRTYRHELESFAWVLLYAALCVTVVRCALDGDQEWRDRWLRRGVLRSKCIFKTSGPMLIAFNSHLQAVLSSLEFDDPVKKVEWKCLEGGSKVLVDAMLSHLNTKPSYNHRVTSVEEVFRLSRDIFPNDRDWPRCPDHPYCPRCLIHCLPLP